MIETTYLSICEQQHNKKKIERIQRQRRDNKRTNNINTTAKYQAARQPANMNANRWNKWKKERDGEL